MAAVGKWRKRPVVVDAVRLDHANRDEVAPWCSGRASEADAGALLIDTLEGTMVAAPGDWIIRGVAGEVYPCRADISAATYEPAG